MSLSLPIPDLLCAEAALRVDRAELRQALVFAFAATGDKDTFTAILAQTALPPSQWDPSDFARDLFLNDLLAGPLSIRLGNRPIEANRAHLLRVLAAPPTERAHVDQRRAVMAELAGSKELRADLERTYATIIDLRSLLTSSALSARLRRIDILRSIHALFETMAPMFQGARSALHRIGDFARNVVESDAFKTLSALLDHEAHLGTVDLRVRVGADGEVRTLQVVGVRENRQNPYHRSPLGRFFAKIGLFLRGYRVTGGEVVEGVFDNVFSGLEEALVLALQLALDIEVFLAGLALRDRALAAGLPVCMPELGAPDTTMIRLASLWNPHLLRDGRVPSPCDLESQHVDAIVVITGPNSGGKTRLLQAVALAQLLGEGGFFVPAKSATLPRVPGLFVSIVEEARADQPEGQLGMELLRIRRMFERLEAGALVLLDELCSGTNPSEGEEIARLVLTLFPELSARVFVTTHLLPLAAHLVADRPIASLEPLQVELDDDDRPTYRFVPGVARTSLAKKTAARLGVTKDELLGLIAGKRKRTRTLDKLDSQTVADVLDASVRVD